MSDFVFITGATSGFGKACATIFAKNGYNLVLTGRRKERLEELKSELTLKFSVTVVISCFDVRDEAQVIEDEPQEVS